MKKNNRFLGVRGENGYNEHTLLAGREKKAKE
jgi:hypothetical protein